jgi:hypothetical protein
MALALLASANNAAAAQRAVIGVITSDGEIQLYRERFQEKFPDGMAVAEVKASISNGFLYLTRKGFDAQGACLQHVTRVVDAQGLHITTLNPNQRLHLPELVAVDISGCNDSGCRDDIHAPSRCNITEKSGGRCRCHIVGPDNEVFVATNESLCWSWADRLTSILSHWIKPSFIQEI